MNKVVTFEPQLDIEKLNSSFLNDCIGPTSDYGMLMLTICYADAA